MYNKIGNVLLLLAYSSPLRHSPLGELDVRLVPAGVLVASFGQLLGDDEQRDVDAVTQQV